MYVHLFPARTAPDDHDAPLSPSGGRPGWLTRIPVRSMNRIVIVPVMDIVRLEAEDNYVRIWADRPYLHKETLTGLILRLDPAEFLRVHRSHAVNIRLVRELRPQLHGEYVIKLTDGTELTSGRSYRGRIQDAFGLSRIGSEA
jgi:two-component system, LytTR family, response regulator